VGCLAGHPKGRAEWSAKANVHVYYSRVRASYLRTHDQRIRVRGVLSYGVGHAVAQLEMSLLEGSYLIEDEPLKPRDRCLRYDSRLGVSLFGTQTD